MASLKDWIGAARIRTLPLAVSTMVVGHSLAYHDGAFQWVIAIYSILTAVCLQILSNFANDYGDSIHGADHAKREGPSRAVQEGIISTSQMQKAMYLFAIIALILGVLLILSAFDSWALRGLFFGLGLLAIWSAINYTAGSKPYGYSGKGDLAVFVFFGIVTVLGSYYLQTSTLRWALILPATSSGLLSVGVLNVNNIRDIHSDKIAGKMSIPVKIGRSSAILYHGGLLTIAAIALILFGLVESFGFTLKWIFVLTLPLLIVNFIGVRKHDQPLKLDPYLKQLALSTTAILLIFCLGLFL